MLAEQIMSRAAYPSLSCQGSFAMMALNIGQMPTARK
jgi:hypothetical protein